MQFLSLNINRINYNYFSVLQLNQARHVATYFCLLQFKHFLMNQTHCFLISYCIVSCTLHWNQFDYLAVFLLLVVLIFQNKVLSFCLTEKPNSSGWATKYICQSSCHQCWSVSHPGLWCWIEYRNCSSLEGVEIVLSLYLRQQRRCFLIESLGFLCAWVACACSKWERSRKEVVGRFQICTRLKRHNSIQRAMYFVLHHFEMSGWNEMSHCTQWPLSMMTHYGHIPVERSHLHSHSDPLWSQSKQTVHWVAIAPNKCRFTRHCYFPCWTRKQSFLGPKATHYNLRLLLGHIWDIKHNVLDFGGVMCSFLSRLVN